MGDDEGYYSALFDIIGISNSSSSSSPPTSCRPLHQQLTQVVDEMDVECLEGALKELQECQRIVRDELSRRINKIHQDSLKEHQHHVEASSSPPTSSVIPIKVLDQICLSNFLTIKETGRLLLLVSKSLLWSYGIDSVWEILCCRKFKHIAQIIPRSMVEKKGYEWIFRRLSNDSKEVIDDQDSKSAPIITDPSLSYDNLQLLISIRGGNEEEEIVSLGLRDGPLKKFLDEGELNVSLKDTIHVGKFPLSDDGTIEFATPKISKWKATMHLLRSDRSQIASIHRTLLCTWGEYDYLDDPSIGQEKDDERFNLQTVDWNNMVSTVPISAGEVRKDVPEDVDMGYLEFSARHKLEFTYRGRTLEEHIREWDAAHHTATNNDIFESIKIEPSLICNTVNNDKYWMSSSNSVELVSKELRLDAWKLYKSGAASLFHSGNESKKHGVTLFHLLDELVEWEGTGTSVF